MLIRHAILLFSLFISYSQPELFSLISGTAIALSGGTFWALKDTIKCKLYECCNDRDVFLNYHQLSDDLDRLVFGQHLVKDIVVNSIKSHWNNENPSKPLVISFHGSTGSGKNYVAEIIANNTYRLGLRSSFVHHIVATNDFPDKTKTEFYQTQLREVIKSTVNKCQRSLFIFDEIDKLPDSLLSPIKPFLDYHSSVSGVDFRKSIFIFLSNNGGSVISEITLSHYESGYPRKHLKMESFERDLMKFSFNEKGGLHMSDLIKNQLIDHFVPFLPLQREHVKQCVKAYLKKRNRLDVMANTELIERVLNSIQYFPESSKAFSSSGCKRIDKKTDLEIEKIRPVTTGQLHEDDL